MSADRRQQIEALFESALDLPTADRAEWLEAACADDGELSSEVEALLAAHELAERVFDESGSISHGKRKQRIGAYRVLRELGRGGMGIVYLAERDDGQYRRRAAIKLIRSVTEDDPLYQRFLAERQILAGLDHPNIARMIDGGVTEDGRPYLVMEYVEGLPITTYCDRHRLGIDERLRLFLDVCSAVQHAHQNLVIHRDLKPSNILVTPDSQVKLLDFGIAKLLNPVLSVAAGPVTETEFRVMTPEYASPEQVRGEGLTTASDVYSLGILLYELLAGHPPYRLTTRSPGEVFQLVCERDPDRPSTRVTETESVRLPDDTQQEITPGSVSAARNTSVERLRRRLRGDLDSIVLMALRKEPNRRYGSAELLRLDLRRYLDGHPVLAHQGSRRYRVTKFMRRHRLQVTAASTVALSLLVGLGAALWQAGLARAERGRAEAALTEAQEVADFLLGLFEAGDPSETLGVEITARELLERGTARVDSLAAQPLVQARMFGVVGRVYQSLGQYERADSLLSRALALHRGRLGPASAEAVADIAALAELRYLRGEYAPAESLYREVLAAQRRTSRWDTLAVARTLGGLARTRGALGAHDEAEALYREAIEMQRTALGDDDEDLSRMQSRLAQVLHSKGDYDAAEAILVQTLAQREQRYGDAHPEIADNLIQLAGIAAARDDDYSRAEALHRRALDVRRRVYGEDHPDVAISMIRVAGFLTFQEKYSEAEPLLREGLTMQRRLLGPDHPEVGGSANSLALLLIRTGRVDEAESYFREALNVYRTAYGPEHHFVAAVLGNLGRVAQLRGDLTEAERIFRKVLADRRRALGPEHPYTTASLLTLAGLLRECGDVAGAEALYLEAAAHYQKRSNAVDELRQVYGDLADLYAAWGRSTDAARARDRAAALVRPPE